MKKFDDLIKYARTRPLKKVAVAVCHDEEVLEAVASCVEQKICNFILFGDKEKTLDIVNKNHLFAINDLELHDVKDNTEACMLAVKAVSSGQADVLMKGLVDTSVILKEVLNKEYGLRTGKLLSHVMMLELPKLQRIVFLSDGAMNIDPDASQLIEITNNAVRLARSLGFDKPKVALLSAVEKLNPKMLSTIKCQDVVNAYHEGKIENCYLEGPLALDLALSSEAAKVKGINSEVAGHADILIVPYIEVGNALYKGWVFATEGVKNAGVVLGAKCPIVLTSRADNHEAKVYSIALSVSID